MRNPFICDLAHLVIINTTRRRPRDSNRAALPPATPTFVRSVHCYPSAAGAQAAASLKWPPGPLSIQSESSLLAYVASIATHRIVMSPIILLWQALSTSITGCDQRGWKASLPASSFRSDCYWFRTNVTVTSMPSFWHVLSAAGSNWTRMTKFLV